MLINLLKKGRSGFTLVELMIVITVIAILATIAVASFTRVQKQARDTKRKGDMQTLATSLQAYYTENNSYPAALSTLVSTYLPSLPTPPAGGSYTVYSYSIGNGGNIYGLCVDLEAPAAIWNVNTSNTGGYTNGTCDGAL